MRLVACLQSLDVDLLAKQVLVLLQWVVGCTELVVRWTDILLEAAELFGLLHVALDGVVEVLLRELTVIWYPVVQWCWLVVPKMLEASHVGVAEHEWQVRVAIVDSTKLLTLKECLNVVFDNWSLNVSGVLSSCSLTVNAVTESENVVESLMLKSVWAYIDHTVLSRNT
jgi:hypothetical protein